MLSNDVQDLINGLTSLPNYNGDYRGSRNVRHVCGYPHITLLCSDWSFGSLGSWVVCCFDFDVVFAHAQEGVSDVA